MNHKTKGLLVFQTLALRHYFPAILVRVMNDLYTQGALLALIC